MNRREFLKFPAVVALLAAYPSFGKNLIGLDELKSDGFVREIMAYDIYLDAMRLRHDIFDGKTQYHTNFIFDPETNYFGLNRKDWLIKIRKIAINTLMKGAKKNGMGKLVRLELPQGVYHARYV